MSDVQAATNDRRHGPSDPLMAMVQQIHDNQERMQDGQAALDAKVTQHMATVPQELAAAIAQLMADSFPGGDPAGHKRYHEASIKAAEDRAAFWAKLRFELAKWGLFGFLGWAAYALWQAFLQGPHK